MSNDKNYMQHAIRMACENPSHPFGAILVDRHSDTVVAEGVNQSRTNPVLHGEIDAIQNCAALQTKPDWKQLTLFTTAEPCPMCISAVLWSGISEVVFGTSIPKLVELGWSQIRLRATEIVLASDRPQTILTGGFMKAECDQLFVKAAERCER